MKRGQTTLEYILLIGIAAVGLIVMLVYVSRGHQGNLRSQADQLSAGQYTPGKTIIDNSESKTLISTASSGSITNVEHPVTEGNISLDVNDPYTPRIIIQDEITKWTKIEYEAMDEYEKLLASECDIGAADVKLNGLPWPTAALQSELKINEYIAASDNLGNLYDVVVTIEENFKNSRKPDKTTTGSYSKESGVITTNKSVSETLGGL